MGRDTDIGQQVGNICVGALLLLFDPAGGASIVGSGLVALALRARQTRNTGIKAAIDAAARRATDALAASSEFQTVNRDRLTTLLQTTDRPLDPDAVRAVLRTTQPEALPDALTEKLLALVAFDGDDD
ncbi:MAG: hypothetical protein AAF264_13535, partial [Pseudomonadota bacterium]